MEKNFLKLFCPNCGSTFEAAEAPRMSIGNQGKEYVCPVCEYYPVLPQMGLMPGPTELIDFEKSVRQILIKARAGGLANTDIIAVLKNELEFAAETGETGHSFLVQLIDLGSPESSNNPVLIPESRDSL
jgi:hypothetical protein